MTTLENLYYGNITPNDRSIKRGGRFDNLLKLSSRNEEELVSTLTDKQKETFEKYKDCYNEMFGVAEVNAFVNGFTLAMKIMVDVCNTDYDTDENYI